MARIVLRPDRDVLPLVGAMVVTQMCQRSPSAVVVGDFIESSRFLLESADDQGCPGVALLELQKKFVEKVVVMGHRQRVDLFLLQKILMVHHHADKNLPHRLLPGQNGVVHHTGDLDKFEVIPVKLNLLLELLQSQLFQADNFAEGCNVKRAVMVSETRSQSELVLQKIR